MNETAIRRRGSTLRATAAFWLLATSLAPALAGGAESPTAEGLWEGLAFIEPAVVEVELGFELARTADGRWVGTYDDPARNLRHELLDGVAVDGRRVELTYTFEIPGSDRTIPYRWTGELAADGETLAGEMIEGGGEPVAFALRRLGPPGMERPEPREVPVVALSEAAAELREAFNRSRDHVRVVMLLSPTCGRCLSGAGIVGRRVLPQASAGEVAVLTVWGPMFGEETREDARRAASRLAYPGMAHFWTAGQELALDVGAGLGLPAGRPGWDIYLVYPPGAVWEAALPAPAAYFLPAGRTVPEERRFHGDRLAAEVLRLAAPNAPATTGAEAPADPR